MLEFSWEDSFSVNPMHGAAAFGYPTKYIPAELTGTFQLMSDRKMDVMRSPTVANPADRLLFLLLFLWLFGMLYSVGLAFKTRRIHIRAPVFAEEHFEYRR